MNRQEKEVVIQSLMNDFAQSNATFLVGFKGITVRDLQDLRKTLRPQGGKLKVTKARLMRKAAESVEGSANALNPFFKNQIGVVFAKSEPSNIAKVLHTFAKKNQSLQLVAGIVDNQLYDAQLITRIAQLPSREMLLALLCGTLKAPISKLVMVLDAIAKKNEQK